jgi:hypothetical protein
MKPLLKHRGLSVHAVRAAMVLFACSAAAQEQNRPRDAQSSETVAPRAIGGVQAPNARLAALIDAGGRPVRTKGVQSVERIDTGVFCIRPTDGSGINVNTMIALVSPEYYYSQLNEVTVQWASTQSGCGAGRFGVYTFQDSDRDGHYVFSNRVGFSVIVP